MAGLKGDNPVEQLREKLARDARWRVREQYFALRIVPVLLVWALLIAAATVAAGGLISLGAALTIYFSVAVLLVILARASCPALFGRALDLLHFGGRGGQVSVWASPLRSPGYRCAAIQRGRNPCAFSSGRLFANLEIMIVGLLRSPR